MTPPLSLALAVSMATTKAATQKATMMTKHTPTSMAAAIKRFCCSSLSVISQLPSQSQTPPPPGQGGAERHRPAAGQPGAERLPRRPTAGPCGDQADPDTAPQHQSGPRPERVRGDGLQEPPAGHQGQRPGPAAAQARLAGP